jgi:hypothetical protein
MVESTVVAEWIAQAKRADLLRILKLRFPAQAVGAVAMTIESQTDVEILSRWLDAAATARSWEEFRATAGI